MQINVHAGPHPRSWCPVRALLPVEPGGSLVLREMPGGGMVPCQWEAAEGGTSVTWILDALPAGATRTYAVEAAKGPADAAPVGLEDLGGKVNVTQGGSLLTSYHYGPQYPRPFLYPLVGPYGHGVTRNYPMREGVPGETSDHPHHRSLYTAYGEVNGVDDWSEVQGHGRIVHRGFSALVSGPAYARIVAQNDWVSASGAHVVAETRDMAFYNTPPTCRLMDYTVTFHAGDQPLTFGDTKEGGILSVRVASSMDVSRGMGGQITNAYGGINEAETWGKPSPWCDYAGPVAGRMVGIALMDHPQNLRHPTQWHVRDYGLMTANCFGWSYYWNDKSLDGSYTVAPHSDLAFRYRVYVHPGDASGVAGRFLDFAFPPTVSVDGA